MALDPLIQDAIFKSCELHGQVEAREVIMKLVDKFSDQRLDSASLNRQLKTVYDHLTLNVAEEDL